MPIVMLGIYKRKANNKSFNLYLLYNEKQGLIKFLLFLFYKKELRYFIMIELCEILKRGELYMKKKGVKTKKTTNIILDKLEELYPDAECELNYSTPFELLVATILSAQCTDVRVNIVTNEMFKKYNTPEDFAALTLEQISEEIKTCGLYKSKAQKIRDTSIQLCLNYGGEVPDSLEELIKLPGVGRKTAGVVLSNAFGQPAIAVDTHVFRVSNRIGIVDEPTPEKTEFALMKAIPKERWSKSHHTLIFHGRRMCKARKPECGNCTITEYCNYYKDMNKKVNKIVKNKKD